MIGAVSAAKMDKRFGVFEEGEIEARSSSECTSMEARSLTDVNFVVNTDGSLSGQSGAASSVTVDIYTSVESDGPQKEQNAEERNTTEANVLKKERGKVIGKIVLETEVDDRFFPRHEVLSSLESGRWGSLPVLCLKSRVSASGPSKIQIDTGLQHL